LTPIRPTRPDAVAAQRVRRLGGGQGVELAALEQRRDHGLGKDEQRRRARQREEEGQAQAPVEHARVAGGVAAALRRRQVRDEDGAEGDAESEVGNSISRSA
jgi:hypothetical protein